RSSCRPGCHARSGFEPRRRGRVPSLTPTHPGDYRRVAEPAASPSKQLCAERALIFPPPRRALPGAAQQTQGRFARRSSWIAPQREPDFWALEEDFSRRLGRAALHHELDRAVEVRLAPRESFRERQRVPGLDEHMQPPALDL